jgi:ATP-dependent DNA ligase
VLDGELVAFSYDGRPDFHLLRRKRVAVVTFLFDVLECNGADLRGKPWRERRRYLERVMQRN